MRSLMILSVAVAVTSCGDLHSAAAQRRGPSDGRLASRGWWSNYDAARDQARHEDKPLLVMFRCGP